MAPFAVVLLAPLALAARPVQPVLQFPEAGLDDPAAYRDYQTRFFRDTRRNTIQAYLDGREGRVVNVWANAENESMAFSIRAAEGGASPLRWGTGSATVSQLGRQRTVTYPIVAATPRVSLGWFLLGSMRVERDFQYQKLHARPFSAPRYEVPEARLLVTALARLEPAARRAHLQQLAAADLPTLERRLLPQADARPGARQWALRVVQPFIDGRDTITLEVRVDPRQVEATFAGDSLTLAARSGSAVAMEIAISTTTAPLNPLARSEIFSAEFLRFLATEQGNRSPEGRTRARWLERQVRGVELLSSREKLMAGMPTYATYFGRDMLMSALMMRPIWRPEMSEFVIAAALRKLSPAGEVSHEEALGGQAVRETAVDYARLVDSVVAARTRGDEPASARFLAAADTILRHYRRPRENYHMIDDELQLPVMVARWLGDPAVTAARKRAFLLDSSDGQGPRLRQLLRAFAVVARMTRPYADRPAPQTLIGFTPRDATRWSAHSWRDSGVGYANGRFAMDVNAIWAPQALRAIASTLSELQRLGWDLATLARLAPDALGPQALGMWTRDPATLQAAIKTWDSAAQLFEVRHGPAAVRAGVTARLAAMPPTERAHWEGVLAATGADRDSLVFDALALDASGRPIEVVHTDAATRLFLVPTDVNNAADRARVLRDVRLFVRAYPVGLMIDKIGPVVANDAWATPDVWKAFVDDPYHGPRVIWGREVHLFLQGLATMVAAAEHPVGLTPERSAFATELRAAIERVAEAVEASGFRNELWSYEFPEGRPRPVRYGSGGDIQLWSTTDLAVQFLRARIGRR